MKKKLLLAVIMLFTISTASIQAQNLLNFGIKAGANMSNVSGLADIQTSLKTGFTGGVSLELRPIDLIGISVDALYSADGFKTEPLQIGGEQLLAMDATLGFIDLPIMAKIYIWKGLSVNLGVMPSFVVSSKLKIGGGEEPFKTNTAAFSIPVGIAYHIGLGLSIEGRYNIALSDLNNAAGTNFGAEYNIKREAFSFLIGYRF